MGRGTAEADVRGMTNLYKAFAIVRSNVNASGRKEFKAQVKQISEDPLPYLRRIQTQLKNGSFVFDKQHGVLKKKPTGKTRPIVVSPINNRIVQRAILNILQREDKRLACLLGEIGNALRTSTSVGGIPGRGVSYGINLVNHAIKDGATHYLRSDIREFFTKIPKLQVVDFVRNQTGDDKFAALFEQAMATELENADEIKDWLHLFPLEDIGVPQGSSLSAFAGNVVLRDFDQRLNGRNITTIRYIDDFVILGQSEKDVQAAFASATSILKGLGMEAYKPDERTDKSKVGQVSDGFDFLGCCIKANSVMPSRKSKQKFLEEIRGTLKDGRRAIKTYASSDKKRRAEEAFVQVLARVDRKIRGWGDAFSFTNDRLTFHQLDSKISQLLTEFFEGHVSRFMKSTVLDDRIRRALGIALLKDTPCPH